MAEAQLLEAWQQKVKQRSMTILRDVQKLLGHLKEGSYNKLSGVASEIGQHAVELMNAVEDVGFTSKAGEAILQTLGSLKSTLVATMKQAEGVSNTTDDEAAQDQLRNECKSTAALIKQLNQQVAELTPADLSSTDTPDKDEKSANGEAPEWLQQMHQESTKAGDALTLLQKAAIDHDQPNLVGSAKNLSAHCAELLNEARRRKKDALVRYPLLPQRCHIGEVWCYTTFLVEFSDLSDEEACTSMGRRRFGKRVAVGYSNAHEEIF
jgi:hypothetical protein